MCGRREKPGEVRAPREQVAWERGAEVKSLLGSRQPDTWMFDRRGDRRRRRVLQAERPGIGKEVVVVVVVGDHRVASLQVARQGWAVHLHALSASYCQESQLPVGSASE